MGLKGKKWKQWNAKAAECQWIGMSVVMGGATECQWAMLAHQSPPAMSVTLMSEKFWQDGLAVAHKRVRPVHAGFISDEAWLPNPITHRHSTPHKLTRYSKQDKLEARHTLVRCTNQSNSSISL